MSQLSLASQILDNFFMGKTPLFSYYDPSIRQPSWATRNIRQFQTITMLNKRNIFKQFSSDNRPIKYVVCGKRGLFVLRKSIACYGFSLQSRPTSILVSIRYSNGKLDL